MSRVAGVVRAIAGAKILEGATYAATGWFRGGGRDPWTATVDYGDGSGVQPLALTAKTFGLSHVYGGVGSGPFTVTVTVADDDSAAGTAHASVTVKVNHPPVANAGPAVSGFEGTAVQFDGTGSPDPDGLRLTYSRTFGAGPPPRAPTPSLPRDDHGSSPVP